MSVAADKWRKKGGATGPVVVNETMNRTKGFHLSRCMGPAEFYLLEEAQKGLKVKGTKMLTADMLTEDILGIMRQLILLGSKGFS
jgi:hypothetical protein